MNYDQWLIRMEHKYRGWDQTYQCPECDSEVDNEGDYCSSSCYEASTL